jgi:hypothetical protein
MIAIKAVEKPEIFLIRIVEGGEQIDGLWLAFTMGPGGTTYCQQHEHEGTDNKIEFLAHKMIAEKAYQNFFSSSFENHGNGGPVLMR